MSVCFNQGEEVGRGDLDIFFTSQSTGNPTNVYSISYALYCIDPGTEQEILIGSAARTPVNPQVGEYYAALQIPPNAAIGDYVIRWVFKRASADPEEGAVMEFCVVGDSTSTSSSVSAMGPCAQELVSRLRFLLRDRDPDHNYRFRPPEGEGEVGCFNQVFGYIWTDEELLEFLKIALDKWNMHPPATDYLCTIEILCQRKPSWRAALLWGALVNAAQALAYNWVADEFSYSIGGISLDIEKSSKYMDLKRNAEEQWDKLTEAKSRTTKYVAGLRQPRFGRGVRSAFGPHVGRGVLSPRGFVVAMLSLGGYWMVEMINHSGHMSPLLS